MLVRHHTNLQLQVSRCPILLSPLAPPLSNDAAFCQAMFCKVRQCSVRLGHIGDLGYALVVPLTAAAVL